MSNRAIVLDAHIRIPAVLGKRALALIFDDADVVQFFAPDVACADARKCLSSLWEKRGVQSEPAMAVLDALESRVLDFRPRGALLGGLMPVRLFRYASTANTLGFVLMTRQNVIDYISSRR